MKKQKEIVISGGGLAGLIAAVAFGDSGYEVLCIDPTGEKKFKQNRSEDYSLLAAQPVILTKDWGLATCGR